jgi:CRP/FNR family cyclic AMP-dependent transcriptional regulator
MEDIKVLKNIPLFSTLTQMELVQVAKSVHNHRMKKGTLIIEEGSEEGSLFVLKTGSASVYRITQRGEKKILGRFSAGDWFGEVSLIDHLARSASIVLDEDSELLEVKKEDFQGMMAADMKLKCKLQEGMMNDLCHKLRRTNDILLLME